MTWLLIGDLTPLLMALVLASPETTPATPLSCTECVSALGTGVRDTIVQGFDGHPVIQQVRIVLPGPADSIGWVSVQLMPGVLEDVVGKRAANSIIRASKKAYVRNLFILRYRGHSTELRSARSIADGAYGVLFGIPAMVKAEEQRLEWCWRGFKSGFCWRDRGRKTIATVEVSVSLNIELVPSDSSTWPRSARITPRITDATLRSLIGHRLDWSDKGDDSLPPILLPLDEVDVIASVLSRYQLGPVSTTKINDAVLMEAPLRDASVKEATTGRRARGRDAETLGGRGLPKRDGAPVPRHPR